jgi:hypothetical protein
MADPVLRVQPHNTSREIADESSREFVADPYAIHEITHRTNRPPPIPPLRRGTTGQCVAQPRARDHRPAATEFGKATIATIATIPTYRRFACRAVGRTPRILPGPAKSYLSATE